ncbi:MAG TPA: hypothetical protein VIJ39_04420 [Solirubrobacteraceae bacterium]
MLFAAGFDSDSWQPFDQFDCSCVLFCLDGSGKPQIIAEDQVEGLGQLTRNAVLVVNHQPLEEGEVELPPHSGRCFAVGRLAVPHPREGTVHVGLGGLEVAFCGHAAAFDGRDLGSDPCLLALEQVERDGIGVVGIEQLLALICELAQSPLRADAFVLRIGMELGQLPA